MADASVIDIGGTQWNVKDKEARDKITVIEDLLTTKILPDPTFTRNTSYSWKNFKLTNHYSFGKIHFIYIRLENVSGNGIGTTNSAKLGEIDILPAKLTSFMLFDYVNGRTMRCYLETDGSLYIGESNGVSSGNNICFGELIFAEV